MATAQHVHGLVAPVPAEHTGREHDRELRFAGVSAPAPHLPRLRPAHRSMERFDGRTALLVVDLQNDFADPAGSLAVVGGDAVVPVANAAVDEALAAGAGVGAPRDWAP